MNETIYLNDELFEISLSKFTKDKVSKSLLKIDKPTIFLTIPDFNLNIYKELYNAGLTLSNCEGIIVPNKMIKSGIKKINGNNHYIYMKKQMSNIKSSGKKLKVISTMINFNKQEHESKNYVFYDMTVYAENYNKSLMKMNDKIAGKYLFDDISRMYTFFKKKFPIINVEILFLIKNGLGIYNSLFNNIKKILPKQELQFIELYDNFLFVSNCNKIIIPIMHKYKFKNIINISSLNRLKGLLETKEIAEDIAQDSIIDIDNTNNKDNTISSQLSAIKMDTKIDKEGHINIDINQKELSKVLKKYNINDPDVIANVKTYIDQFISKKGDKLTQSEAEETVLKAIHYTVYGTDVIKDEFKINPNKLINKLKEKGIHRTPLNFPVYKNSFIQPKDVIDIEYTSGVWRQKQEFEKTIHKNVHKLFESLETGERPVKIQKVKWNIIDDNKTRKIIYDITLKNTNGGFKDEYVVNLEVPTTLNDRYFKINGTSYIMNNQQFLKPVTKTNDNEVRLLTNYGPVHLELLNVKFNPSQINQIINYIYIRYPKLLKEKTDDYCVFSDNSIIYFNGNKIYKNKNLAYNINDKNDIIDNNGNKINISGKNELIYTLLIHKIKTINNEDELTKTKKSIPYIAIYVTGIRIPFIVYLWQLKGLLTTLNGFSIDYEMSNKLDNNKYAIQMTNNQYLIINPKTKKEEYICNGLLVNKIKDKIENFENPSEIYPYITKNYGQKAISYLNLATKNQIDPVTKELLEFDNLPTSLPNLLSEHCIDKLLNDEPSSLSDLKIYRTRLSEIILNIMYSQIKMAQNDFMNRVEMGDKNAKINFRPTFIIDNLITESSQVLQVTEPINPIDEIDLASKTIKTGPGGVPPRSFKTAHRILHKSQIGIMSAAATNEDSKVGINVSHTLTPSIINEYGSYGAKEPNSITGWNTVSINEALTPFINQIGRDRHILACKHSTQVTPTSGNEVPLVGTGAEFIVPQISSTRFVQKAKKDGEIIEVSPNKFITIKYKDNSTETFDILPRMSRSKMSQFISLEMDTLSVGDKVKKNQVIAHTRNFSDDGIYCSGKNSVMAILNYNGFSHEDAYAISEDIANQMSRDLVREINIVIPPNTKLLNIIKEKKNVTKKDILVEFTYEEGLDKYIQLNQIEEIDDESGAEYLNQYSNGDNSIKTYAEEGEIIDIKIYINNKNSIDKKIVQFHNELKSDILETIDKLSKSYNTEDEKRKATDNMDLTFLETGNHKLKGGNEFKGAKIVYYIRQKVGIKVGDKMSGRYGNKGIVSKIITKDFIPKSENFEKIDCFISPIGVFSRSNQAMVKELYLGKIIYFLNKQIKDMAQNVKISTNKIINLITDIYGILLDNDTNNNIIKRINTIKPETLRNSIKQNKIKVNIDVPPFKNVSFENIKEAADLLNIELDEKVYLPEFDTWTKEKVPVGISYMQAMEQTGEIYSNVRSYGKYQELTGLATKGRAKEGGQGLGNLDVYALLTLGSPMLLKELMGARADDHKAKRQIINNIMTNGFSKLPTYKSKSQTIDLTNVYMISMGVEMI